MSSHRFCFSDSLAFSRAPEFLPSQAASRLSAVSDVYAAVNAVEPGSVSQLSMWHRQSLVVMAHSTRDHDDLLQLSALIEEKDQAFRRALLESSLPRETVDLLVSFVDFHLCTQAAIHGIELDRIVQSLKGRATAEMGTAEELAAALDVSAETVRRRTVDRTLIAVLAPGRKRGREYPLFQAWPGIAGGPLEAVLEALGHPEGPEAYQFMTSPTDFLGGLTPIEVLVADAPPHADLVAGARDFLDQADDVRLRAVVDAATQRRSVREGA